MKYHFLLLLMFSMAACHKESSTPGETLWIRADNPADTIIFNNSMGNYFTLKRGFSINENGLKTPKAASGIYDYQLMNDSISLYWTLSSSLARNKYYFIRNDSELRIGNFIDKNATLLIFKKH